MKLPVPISSLVLLLAATWLGGEAAILFAAGTGLSADYYDNSDFTSLKVSRTDATVNFDWGTAAPASGVGADSFSVRWYGQVEPRFSETYTFYVTADDGARLWVNDQFLAARTFYASSGQEIAGHIALQAGRRYNLRLEFIENSGNAFVRLGWASPSQAREIIPQSQLYPALASPECGALLQEYWMDLNGTNITMLTPHVDYPNRPDGRGFLINFECLQAGWSDNYGTRVTGLIVPPTNGSYRFAVAGDDQAQLFLSPDASATNKQWIAAVPAATGFREWTRFTNQVSAPVSLVVGQKYYVELLHKEGTGQDHFSVAWQTPGSTQWEIIPAEALVPAGLDRSTPAQGDFLDTLAPTHPRLLAGPERFEWLKRQLASNTIPQLVQWYVAISNSAAGLLDDPVSTYTPDERGTILGISRQVLDRVYKLALVWRMTGLTNHAERAWAELEAAANFPDWHPAHFLDTAEMTHAFAIGYDWLYDYWTTARRNTIRNAIITLGLNQSLSLYRNNSSWTAASANNWNLVCNGGMVLGALAVGSENATLTEEILARAVASARAVMQHFTTDNGGWYEGPGYWDYSTEYNARMLAALESALGSDFGLSATRALAETGWFPAGITGPNKTSFNFADAGAGNIRGAQLFWIARRFNRPEVAWYERANAGPETLDVVWYDARGADPQSSGLPPDTYFRGPTGTTSYQPAEAVTLRSRWQDGDATFVGFKGGEVGASHGHLDAGGFVLDALGRRWAHDLGGDSYALPGYFGSQRWDYYRLRAEGHNTLVINPGSGDDQIVGARPPIVIFNSEEAADRSAVVADLTSAYGVTRAWRGLLLFNGRRQVLVQDEIQTAAPATVWWFMHLQTNEQPQLGSDATSVMLTQGSDRLWGKIVSGGGVFTLRDAAPLPTSPNPSGQNSNATYQKLAIQLASVTSTTLAVWFVPLNPGETPPTNLPVLTALRDWATPRNDPLRATLTNLMVLEGGTLDVDLRALTSDLETAGDGLWFSAGASTNGTLAILPDGHTARFVPATNYYGLASFSFAGVDQYPDTRLLLHYSFEPPVSSDPAIVTDVSGHYRDGVLDQLGSGSFAFAPEAPAALAPHSRQSLRLAGSGAGNAARLSLSLAETDYDLSNSDWTLAAWFRRATNNTDDFLFYIGGGDGFSGSGDEFQLYASRNQATVALGHWNSGNTQDVSFVSSASVAALEWHHVAVVFDRTGTNTGALRLYLDGVLVGNPTNVTWALNQSAPLRFGGHGSTTFATDRWLDGWLDDLALFNAALSAGDIAKLATRTIGHWGGTSIAQTVHVAVAINHAPVLSSFPGQVIGQYQTLGPLAFAVSDLETPAGALRVAATSSNPALIPLTNITVSGGGSPWTNQDIGAVGAVGNAVETGPGLIVNGSGADIWSTADEFHFVYQPLSGNGEILARVTSLVPTDPWAKAGVMIRESTAANARFAISLLSASNGVAFQYRTNTGASAVNAGTATATAPQWVRLSRNGNVFTAYHAEDQNGALSNWVRIASAQSIPMSNDVLVGLAVTSHKDGFLCAAEFDGLGGTIRTGAERALTLTPRAGQSGVATIVVTVSDGLKSASNTFTLTVVPATNPPGVTLVAPANNELLVLPCLLQADADDLDGNLARVEFFLGGAQLGQLTRPPWELLWSAAPPDAYELRAVAFDSAGLSATSAPVKVTVYVPPTVLVSTGAVWRFNDTGQNLGTNWIGPSYQDAGWSNGPAQLGFGDKDEATLVASNRQMTTYFRHSFLVANPALFAGGLARLLRDDGAVGYLNNIEIFRSNLPTNNPILYSTPAVTNVGGADESTNFYTFTFDSALLVPGTNVLAVEVHQQNTNSSDLSFALELLAYTPAALPRLKLAREAGAVTLRWPGWAAGFVPQVVPGLRPPVLWSAVTNVPVLTNSQHQLTLPRSAGHRFYRLNRQ